MLLLSYHQSIAIPRGTNSMDHWDSMSKRSCPLGFFHKHYQDYRLIDMVHACRVQSSNACWSKIARSLLCVFKYFSITSTLILCISNLFGVSGTCGETTCMWWPHPHAILLCPDVIKEQIDAARDMTSCLVLTYQCVVQQNPAPLDWLCWRDLHQDLDTLISLLAIF